MPVGIVAYYEMRSSLLGEVEDMTPCFVAKLAATAEALPWDSCVLLAENLLNEDNECFGVGSVFGEHCEHVTVHPEVRGNRRGCRRTSKNPSPAPLRMAT